MESFESSAENKTTCVCFGCLLAPIQSSPKYAWKLLDFEEKSGSVLHTFLRPAARMHSIPAAPTALALRRENATSKVG